MASNKGKRACETCKKRKKKCSGELPCIYCVKIGNSQDCEYKTRLPKKKVKVSERYITTLKSKVRLLESRLAKINSDNSDDEVQFTDELNPLVERGNSASPNIVVEKNLGDSGCLSFLARIQNTLLNCTGMQSLDQDLSTKYVEFSQKLDWDIVWEAYRDIPSLDKARRLIRFAQRTVGADYLFVNNQYIENTIPRVFYKNKTEIEEQYSAVGFAEELALFYSYLAMGCLFQNPTTNEEWKENDRPNGFAYFEKALYIQGMILKYSDQSNGTNLVQSFLYVAYYSLSVDKSSLAYVLVGNAIRIALVLRLHKKSNSQTSNRLFWLCFLYDRILAIRFGFPLIIEEKDIDIPLYSAFDDNYLAVSLEKYHFEAQIALAKITTNIIKRIYTKNSTSFIHNCHSILKELKSWFDNLPPQLKFDYNNINPTTSRSTINLHINYNYLIILTTRSVAFYVFNKVLSTGKTTDQLFVGNLKEIITILLESSISAAQIQSMILTKLYYNGKMMSRSFLDSHYIFNSSIVLILAVFLRSLPNYLIGNVHDVSVLVRRVQDNLDVLQQISQYNVAAYNLNKQLTELIELISCDKVQKQFQGSIQNLMMEQQQKNENDLGGLSHIDLSEVLDLIITNDEEGDAINSYFDEEDFIRYSNFNNF